MTPDNKTSPKNRMTELLTPHQMTSTTGLPPRLKKTPPPSSSSSLPLSTSFPFSHSLFSSPFTTVYIDTVLRHVRNFWPGIFWKPARFLRVCGMHLIIGPTVFNIQYLYILSSCSLSEQFYNLKTLSCLKQVFLSISVELFLNFLIIFHLGSART